jgi:hypothetical protein
MTPNEMMFFGIIAVFFITEILRGEYPDENEARNFANYRVRVRPGEE